MRESSPPDATRASERGSSPGFEEELQLVPPVGADRPPVALPEAHREARALEGETRQLGRHGARQLVRHPAALDREAAGPLGGGAFRFDDRRRQPREALLVPDAG